MVEIMAFFDGVGGRSLRMPMMRVTLMGMVVPGAHLP
jgi:hypothetical protein